MAALSPLPVEVVTDPGGSEPLAWRCYQECLREPVDTDWLLVLQDDAWPVDGFHERIAGLMPKLEHPTALFLPTTAIQTRDAFWRAQTEGCDLCEHNPREWVPVVALLWPAPDVTRFNAWVDERGYRTARLADDEVVGRWARETYTPVCVAVPSLVEHPEAVDSLVNPTHTRNRHALATAPPPAVS